MYFHRKQTQFMVNDINDLGDFSQVRVVYNTDTHNLSNLSYYVGWRVIKKRTCQTHKLLDNSMWILLPHKFPATYQKLQYMTRFSRIDNQVIVKMALLLCVKMFYKFSLFLKLDSAPMVQFLHSIYHSILTNYKFVSKWFFYP